MDLLHQLPTPDDLALTYLIKIFGPAALIVLLFQLYLLVNSWISTANAGRRGLRRVSGQVRRLLQIGWAARATAVGAVLGAAALLVAWVALSSTMGYGASYLIFANIPLSGPRLHPFLSWNHNDSVHAYHVWGSLTVAVVAVTAGLRRRSAETAGVIFALPWILFGVLMALFTVAYGLVGAYNWSNHRGFQVDVYGVQASPVTPFVLTVVSAAYVRAASAIGRLPVTVVALVTRLSA